MNRSELISPEYAEQNAELHRTSDWGGSGYKHAKTVMEFAKTLGLTSMLDYGCGQGTMKSKLHELKSNIDVFEYDPAIPGKQDLPNKSDIVVCTDVLEHIEPELVDNVLRHLCDLTKGACYLVIALLPCARTLPDGRGCHLIVQSSDWWISKINKLPWTISRSDVEKLGDTDKEKRLKVWIVK